MPGRARGRMFDVRPDPDAEALYPGYPGYGEFVEPDDVRDDRDRRNGAPPPPPPPNGRGGVSPVPVRPGGRVPPPPPPPGYEDEPLYARDRTPQGYDGGDPDDYDDRYAEDGYDDRGYADDEYDDEYDDLEDDYDEDDEYADDEDYDEDEYGVGDAPLSVPPPGSGGRPLGPADVEELDPSMTDALARVDLGAMQVPVPYGAELSLEPAEGGRPQAVHLMLPEGRIAVSALAAPRSSALWRELSAEIEQSLRNGGARVRNAQGDWGRELHARTENAASVFIGADGPRWMVYGVATASLETVDALDVELRRVMRGIIVVRGRLPYPPRTVLPLTLPDHMAEKQPDAGPRKASITVSVPAGSSTGKTAAASSTGATPAGSTGATPARPAASTGATPARPAASTGATPARPAASTGATPARPAAAATPARPAAAPGAPPVRPAASTGATPRPVTPPGRPGPARPAASTGATPVRPPAARPAPPVKEASPTRALPTVGRPARAGAEPPRDLGPRDGRGPRPGATPVRPPAFRDDDRFADRRGDDERLADDRFAGGFGDDRADDVRTGRFTAGAAAGDRYDDGRFADDRFDDDRYDDRYDDRAAGYDDAYDDRYDDRAAGYDDAYDDRYDDDLDDRYGDERPERDPRFDLDRRDAGPARSGGYRAGRPSGHRDTGADLPRVRHDRDDVGRDDLGRDDLGAGGPARRRPERTGGYRPAAADRFAGDPLRSRPDAVPEPAEPPARRDPAVVSLSPSDPLAGLAGAQDGRTGPAEEERTPRRRRAAGTGSARADARTTGGRFGEDRIPEDRHAGGRDAFGLGRRADDPARADAASRVERAATEYDEFLPDEPVLSRMAIEDIPIDDIPLLEAALDAEPVRPALPRRRPRGAADGTARSGASRGGTADGRTASRGGRRRREDRAVEAESASAWMSAEIAARPSGKHAQPGSRPASDLLESNGTGANTTGSSRRRVNGTGVNGHAADGPAPNGPAADGFAADGPEPDPLGSPSGRGTGRGTGRNGRSSLADWRDTRRRAEEGDDGHGEDLFSSPADAGERYRRNGNGHRASRYHDPSEDRPVTPSVDDPMTLFTAARDPGRHRRG